MCISIWIQRFLSKELIVGYSWLYNFKKMLVCQMCYYEDLLNAEGPWTQLKKNDPATVLLHGPGASCPPRLHLKKPSWCFTYISSFIYINPPFPFASIAGFFPSRSLNCSSSEAQGVSREFVQLWQGRDVFPQLSLKSDRLSTPGLSAGPLSSGSCTAGSMVRLACTTICSHTHAQPKFTHSTRNNFSTSTHIPTYLHKECKAGMHANICM